MDAFVTDYNVKLQIYPRIQLMNDESYIIVRVKPEEGSSIQGLGSIVHCRL